MFFAAAMRQLALKEHRIDASPTPTSTTKESA
jgi:hypothetical protein